ARPGGRGCGRRTPAPTCGSCRGPPRRACAAYPEPIARDHPPRRCRAGPRPSVDADDCRVVEVPVALLHQLGVEVTDHLRDREPHTVVLPGLEDDLLVLELVAAGPAPAEVPAEVALALLPQRLRA